jgi:hypothetical protein
MSKKGKAGAILVGAVIIGAIAQGIAKKEAALLGMSALELALVGGAIGSLVVRYMAA